MAHGIAGLRFEQSGFLQTKLQRNWKKGEKGEKGEDEICLLGPAFRGSCNAINLSSQLVKHSWLRSVQVI